MKGEAVLKRIVLVSTIALVGCGGPRVRGPSFRGPSLNVNVPEGRSRVADDEPAPAAEPAPRPIPAAYAHLPERRSFSAKDSVKLQPGFYRGDFTVGHGITVEGSGKDQTVIEGRLIFAKGQAEAKNLTILGDVVFNGSQNDLESSDFRGAIQDNGQQNSY